LKMDALVPTQTLQIYLFIFKQRLLNMILSLPN
jgi:hypothetical protein